MEKELKMTQISLIQHILKEYTILFAYNFDVVIFIELIVNRTSGS